MSARQGTFESLVQEASPFAGLKYLAREWKRMGKLMMECEGLMTPAQFAMAVGVSRQTVYTWLRSGEIEGVAVWGKVWCTGKEAKRKIEERVDELRSKYKHLPQAEFEKLCWEQYGESWQKLGIELKRDKGTAQYCAVTRPVKEDK